MTQKHITPKMVQLMKDLSEEREIMPDVNDRLWKMLRIHESGDTPIPMGKGHEIIDWLLRQPLPPGAEPRKRPARPARSASPRRRPARRSQGVPVREWPRFDN